ncbi:olfactory receptor 5J3-like [Rhea pennata]|uniref:olfactory receptor 5J3-like n=1 Tax=Rhea pennata TaxID=8795 RepID=UPI002E254A4B
MNGNNHTVVTEFILLGLTDHLEWQMAFFVVFLGIYILTLLGNIGLILIIKINTQLHTPMYFFLSNLSLIDLCYSSSITPKTLVSFLSKSKAVSHAQCFAQFSFFAAFVGSECLLLAVMAYDWFVAICKPLLYMVAMSRKVCIFLSAGSFIGGFVNSLVHTSSLVSLSFCGPNIIHHYFCDFPPLLKLACSDTQTAEVLLFTFSGTIAGVTILTILISYLYIFSTILQIQTSKGKHKAFSTCVSHLITVTLLYGSLSFIYMQPSSRYSFQQEKIVSVFYTLLTPILNPLVCSLRNKEVKDALRRAVSQFVS